MTEDKRVRSHHELNGHEFEQTLGDSEGQGRLLGRSPQGCRVRCALRTKRQQEARVHRHPRLKAGGWAFRLKSS